MSGHGAADVAGSELLRGERDRFLAFAFAAADTLIEIGADWRIRFAAGATRTLLDRTPEQLTGERLADLVAPADWPALTAAIESAMSGRRFSPITVHFGILGRPLLVAGTSLPNGGGVSYLTLRAAPPARETPRESRLPLHRTLAEREDFCEAAGRLMRAGAAGSNRRLSLIRADGLQEVADRLDRRAAEELGERIGALFRQAAADGGVAAELGPDRFGLIHVPDCDLDRLRLDIEQAVRALDTRGRGVQVAAASIDLKADGSPGGQGAKALIYAINSFAAGRGDVGLQELAGGWRPLLDRTLRRMGSFRHTIAAGEFDIAFQPVVHLRSRQAHHFEALARFTGPGSPFDSIVFAESVGLIAEFDLAMAGKVLAKLDQIRRRGETVAIAVNISGRSLDTDRFIEALQALLSRYDLAGQVLFEITESAEIRNLARAGEAIASLRAAGYPVCLDDFGAGASAFHYLRALSVDFVKIDGSYVRDALHSSRDQPFLKAIVQLCRDLGIACIGEMVENEATLHLLDSLGVQFGQGYLFGKPMLGLPVRSRPR